MLLLQQRVRPLKRLQALELPHLRWLHRGYPTRPPKIAVAHFFAPPRQHEGMNIQGVGHRLDLDALQLTQFHRLALELQAVTMHFPWTGSSHRHLLLLGESVYFFEGGSQSSEPRLLRARWELPNNARISRSTRQSRSS